MRNANAMMRVLGVAALLGSGACLPTYQPAAPVDHKPDTGPTGPSQDVATSDAPTAVSPVMPQDQTSLFLSAADAATLAAQAADEGPPEIASKRHSCMKMKFDTVGRMLQELGVSFGSPSVLPVDLNTNCNQFITGPTDPSSGAPLTAQKAAYVYCESRQVLGLAQYSSRLAEPTSATTASSTKLLDLFLAAAPEIINAVESGAVCKDAAGNQAHLFATDGAGNVTCQESGVTCIQGFPSTPDQLALCSRVIGLAQPTPANAQFGTPAVSALDNGKRIAISTIMSAIHSCE